jgi:hypothetical protein
MAPTWDGPSAVLAKVAQQSEAYLKMHKAGGDGTVLIRLVDHELATAGLISRAVMVVDAVPDVVLVDATAYRRSEGGVIVHKGAYHTSEGARFPSWPEKTINRFRCTDVKPRSERHESPKLTCVACHARDERLTVESNKVSLCDTCWAAKRVELSTKEEYACTAATLPCDRARDECQAAPVADAGAQRRALRALLETIAEFERVVDDVLG